MGGFAAKQRRRVERQTLQRPQSDFDDDDATAKRSSPHPFRSKTHPYETDRSRARNISQQGKIRSNKSNENTNEKSPRTKKVSNKPKHLKRKIESVCGENAHLTAANLDGEKERLLRQLKEFEQQKKQHSHHNVKTSATKILSKTNTTKNIEGDKVTDKKRKRGNDALAINTRSVVPRRVLSQVNAAIVASTASKIQDTTAVVDSSKKNRNVFDPVIVVRSKTNCENDETVTRTDELIHVAGDDDEDDDDETLASNQNTRQRGKRLRRRGASANTVQQKDETMGANNSIDNGNVSNKSDIRTGDNDVVVVTNAVQEQKQQRRCIGRKPITDFTIGQSYSGTVVYAKPFGLFVDIGCHHDAFCHVSQLSETFVDNPIDTFPIGTKIDNAIRIVEIDRKKKRITVSFIKEAKTQEGDGSADATTGKVVKDDGGGSADQSHVPTAPRNLVSNADNDTTKVGVSSSNHRDEKLSNKARILSPADQLKRDRKLARRAQRREAEVTNITDN